MTTEPGLNDRTAKLMMGHIHRIGMSLSSFESELQGTQAHTQTMKAAINTIKIELTGAQQEIIALRDTKQTGGG